MEWTQGLLRRLDEGQVVFVCLTGVGLGIGNVRKRRVEASGLRGQIGLGWDRLPIDRPPCRLSSIGVTHPPSMWRFTIIVKSRPHDPEQAAAERYIVAKGKQAQVGGWVGKRWTQYWGRVEIQCTDAHQPRVPDRPTPSINRNPPNPFHTCTPQRHTYSLLVRRPRLFLLLLLGLALPLLNGLLLLFLGGCYTRTLWSFQRYVRVFMT